MTFDTPFAIPIPDGPNFVTTADFNQDELQDLVTVNSAAGAGTVSVILNEQPTEDACPADLNDDGFVNISDLLVLLTAWGPCPDDEPCPADLNQDGVVGVVDLLILIFSFGPCPL